MRAERMAWLGVRGSVPQAFFFGAHVANLQPPGGTQRTARLQ